MKSKFQLSNMIHYILIYFMITINQSQLYKNFINRYDLSIVILMSFLLLSKRKYRDFYSFAFLAFILYAVTFIRFYSGGVGLRAWEFWAVKILVTLYAIQYNKELFITRFIKVTTFLAGVSIIGFTLSIISPGVLRSILLAHYPTSIQILKWTSANNYIATPSYTHGLLFFTLRDNEMTRNCGIFTEPGVYQMILNSALFLILFLKNQVNIEDKNKIKYILVLLAVIITCQSTTGYIGTGAIVLAFCISKQEKGGYLKFRLITITFAVLVLLYIDYIMRGAESFLSYAVSSKLFSSSGSLDVSASTGVYRVSSIMISISSMLQHPLGVGYDNMTAIISSANTGVAAAQILHTGAALGIIPFLVILLWIFKPIVRSNMSNCGKILFVFLYFNTALAQSSEFYPTLIMIPMFLHLMSKSDWKSEELIIKQKHFEIAKERYGL